MQTTIGHTAQYLGGSARNLRDAVIDYLGEFAHEYDVDALTAAYRVAINYTLVRQVGTQLCVVGEHIFQPGGRSGAYRRINGAEPEYYVRAAFVAAGARFDAIAERHLITN